jgi:L-gulonolactone oxidase
MPAPPILSSIPSHTLYDLVQPFLIHPSSQRSIFTNWGQTYSCSPLAVFEPHSEAQCELVLELARREGRSVRAVGVGHSPSDLACTSEYMLRTDKLNRVLKVCVIVLQTPTQLISLSYSYVTQVDYEKRYVIAQAGITLHDLHVELAKHDLAMINVGSISDQTLAGIVTTATHGSGINYGVMSTHVLALTLLLADGSRITCSRYENADLFTASICGLGSTGLILSIQLEVEPAFRLREVQETFKFEHIMQNLDRFVYAAEHVRFWWFPTTGSVRVSSSNRTYEVRKIVIPFFFRLRFHSHAYLSPFALRVVGCGILCWDTILYSSSYSSRDTFCS